MAVLNMISGKAPKVAFVSGCNGITGYAIAEHLTKQPPTEWSKILVSSRTPPPNMWTDPRVEFVAADFLEPPEKLIDALRRPCHDVTHVYFASYVHNDDLSKLAEKNVPLFKNFMDVLDEVCPKLERVCLQTGGKHYGVHLGPTKQPVTEDIGRRAGISNFYYQQEDYMFEVQKRRNQWTYNIIRPFGIIGFTRQANGMNMSIIWAVYLLVCKELGTTPHFPGSQAFIDGPDDFSYAPSIADMAVWATTNEHTANEDFNHVSGDPVVFRYFWRELAAYFGIQMMDDVVSLDRPLGKWMKDKRPVWERIVQQAGGSVEAFDACNWDVLNWGALRDWPIFPIVTKARRYGWARYDTAMECWAGTFRAFENAGVLPKPELVGRK